MVFSFYIMANAHKHIIKIGLTKNITRREYQIKKKENLHLIDHITINCSMVDALLFESLLRKKIAKYGLKHYMLDHFKASIEQYHEIIQHSTEILNHCNDFFNNIDNTI